MTVLPLQVDDLKSKLAAQEEELAIKNEDANKLIAVVGAEQEKVSKEKALANDEQKKVAVIAEDVGQKQKVCSIELAKAEPALIAAKAALDTLNKVCYNFSLTGIVKNSVRNPVSDFTVRQLC